MYLSVTLVVLGEALAARSAALALAWFVAANLFVLTVETLPAVAGRSRPARSPLNGL